MVDRAKEQFNALNSDVKEFLNANPIPVEVGTQADTGNHIIKIVNPPEFPRRWGVILGEIVGNSASALNYLIVAFIRKEGEQPSRDAAFPITDTEANYYKLGRGKISFRDRLLAGVDEPIRQRIDDLQPWRRTPLLPVADELSILKFLRDAAEHRDLQAACIRVDLPAHFIQVPATGRLHSATIVVTPQGAPVKVEPEFSFQSATDRIGLTIAQTNQPDPQRPLGFQVSFGGTEHPRQATLGQVKQAISWTRTIIEGFSPAFEP